MVSYNRFANKIFIFKTMLNFAGNRTKLISKKVKSLINKTNWNDFKKILYLKMRLEKAKLINNSKNNLYIDHRINKYMTMNELLFSLFKID
jgi:hypothetical protein